MDLQRLFLFLIFAFSLALIWDGWQRYQHPNIQQAAPGNGEQLKPQTATGAGTLPELPGTMAGLGQAAIVQQAAQPGVAQKNNGKIISVTTDFIRAEINTQGGDLSYLALLKHPDGQDKSKPLVLFHRGEGTHNYVAQSGLLGAGLPNHNTLFVAERDEYALAENTEQVRVRLKAADNASLKVTKVKPVAVVIVVGVGDFPHFPQFPQ